MKISLVVVFISLFFCESCSRNDETGSIVKLSVDFVYDTNNPERSPEIHLKNVPAGVDHLSIGFDDATNEWEHGGGIIPYDGSGVINAGALKEFKGLTTTWAFPKIRLTVKAFNMSNQLVGKGIIVKSPPNQ